MKCLLAALTTVAALGAGAARSEHAPAPLWVVVTARGFADADPPWEDLAAEVMEATPQ